MIPSDHLVFSYATITTNQGLKSHASTTYRSHLNIVQHGTPLEATHQGFPYHPESSGSGHTEPNRPETGTVRPWKTIRTLNHSKNPEPDWNGMVRYNTPWTWQFGLVRVRYKSDLAAKLGGFNLLFHRDWYESQYGTVLYRTSQLPICLPLLVQRSLLLTVHQIESYAWYGVEMV